LIALPEQRGGRPKGSSTRIAAPGPAPSLVVDRLSAVGPVTLERVASPAAYAHWRSLIDRYHPLGHRVPFGAYLRYSIQSPRGVLGGQSGLAPAYPRPLDRLGRGATSTRTPTHRLQQPLPRQLLLRCSTSALASCFALPPPSMESSCILAVVILPSVRVPHLASHVLGLAARRVGPDWAETFGVTPWLLETLVDPAYYRGISYRAANWIEVGLTSGRGRDDRAHQRHGAAPKQVWLYPLGPEARQRLRGV